VRRRRTEVQGLREEIHAEGDDIQRKAEQSMKEKCEDLSFAREEEISHLKYKKNQCTLKKKQNG
jgi:hypothetical protein